MPLILTERHAAWHGTAGAAGSRSRSARRLHTETTAAGLPVQQTQRRRIRCEAVRASTDGGAEVTAFGEVAVQPIGSSPAKQDSHLTADCMEAALPDAASGERQRLLVNSYLCWSSVARRFAAAVQANGLTAALSPASGASSLYIRDV